MPPRLPLVLLWIEYRIGWLRRLIDRSGRMESAPRQRSSAKYEPFDRRDLRMRW